MAINSGHIIDDVEFNALIAEIEQEFNRRGLLTSYDTSNVIENNIISKNNINILINGLNYINSDTTNFSIVNTGDQVISLEQLQIANSTFKNCPKEGNNSGCKSGCIGLCQGCSNNCGSTCGEGCMSDCIGTCSGGCSGTCSRDCQNDCYTGCLTGCKGSCTGCTGTCNVTCLSQSGMA